MGDTGEENNRAPPRSACKARDRFLFRTANDPISSISYFGASSPYLFVKHMYQIGNMEGFVLVENYTRATA